MARCSEALFAQRLAVGLHFSRSEELGYHAGDRRACVGSNEFRKGLCRVLRSQQRFNVEGCQLPTRDDAFRRHGYAADAHPTNDGEQREIRAIEEGPKLLANHGEKITLREVLTKKGMKVSRPTPRLIANWHGEAHEMFR